MRNSALPFITKFFKTSRIGAVYGAIPPPVRSWINEVITIVPCKGKLGPYKSIVVSVNIHPLAEMYLNCEAVCYVKGASEETVQIFGMAAHQKYRIGPKTLDFGFSPFCEYWIKTITIENTGKSPLPYRVLIKNMDDVLVRDNLQPNTFVVIPVNGIIKPYKKEKIYVVYYAGFIGWVEKKFSFEIGYHALELITIKGYATVQQILLNLPKVNVFDGLPVEFYYHTIANIPREMHLIQTPMTPNDSEAELSSCCNEDFCLAYPKDRFYDKYQYEWEKIPKKNETCILVQDITLAVERCMTEIYAQGNRGIMVQHANQCKKDRCIPGFSVSPYELDLGKVILDTTKEFKILIKNVTEFPNIIHIKLPKTEKELKKIGIVFKTQFKLVIPPNAVHRMHIEFTPTKCSYPHLGNILFFVFYFKVQCGPCVPVIAKGYITYPYILAEKVINCGVIKCSQRRELYFRLRNENYIPVFWSIHLRRVMRKPTKENKELQKLDEYPCPFLLPKKNGVLKPNSYADLRLIFHPLVQGFHERMMIVELKDNPEPLKIRIKGNAEEPRIIVNPDTIDFGCKAPYSDVYKQIIEVTNPCSFPIEVFLPQFDNKIVFEESVFTVLTRYYNSRHIYLPDTFYGAHMGVQILNAYMHLAEKAADALGLANTQKSVQDIDRSGKPGRPLSTFADPTQRTQVGGVKPISPVRVTERTHLETPSISSTESRVYERMNVIEEYLSLLENAEEELPRIDLFASEHKTEEVMINEVNEGTLVMVAGTPFSESSMWGNRLAKHLNLFPITLDDLFVFELARSDHQLAYETRATINNEYARIIMGVNPEEIVQIDQLDDPKVLDPVINLKEKIECILEKYVEEDFMEKMRVEEEEEKLEMERLKAQKLEEDEIKIANFIAEQKAFEQLAIEEEQKIPSEDYDDEVDDSNKLPDFTPPVINASDVEDISVCSKCQRLDEESSLSLSDSADDICAPCSSSLSSSSSLDTRPSANSNDDKTKNNATGDGNKLNNMQDSCCICATSCSCSCATVIKSSDICSISSTSSDSSLTSTTSSSIREALDNAMDKVKKKIRLVGGLCDISDSEELVSDEGTKEESGWDEIDIEEQQSSEEGSEIVPNFDCDKKSPEASKPTSLSSLPSSSSDKLEKTSSEGYLSFLEKRTSPSEEDDDDSDDYGYGIDLDEISDSVDQSGKQKRKPSVKKKRKGDEEKDLIYGSVESLDDLPEITEEETNETQKEKKETPKGKDARKGSGREALKEEGMKDVKSNIFNVPQNVLKTIMTRPLAALARVRGIVVDSLRGLFFPRPMETVNLLLQMVGRVRNIHLVVMYSEASTEINKLAAERCKKKFKTFMYKKFAYDYMKELDGFDFARLPEKAQCFYRQFERKINKYTMDYYEERALINWISNFIRKTPLKYFYDEMNASDIVDFEELCPYAETDNSEAREIAETRNYLREYTKSPMCFLLQTLRNCFSLDKKKKKKKGEKHFRFRPIKMIKYPPKEAERINDILARAHLLPEKLQENNPYLSISSDFDKRNMLFKHILKKDPRGEKTFLSFLKPFRTLDNLISYFVPMNEENAIEREQNECVDELYEILVHVEEVNKIMLQKDVGKSKTGGRGHSFNRKSLLEESKRRKSYGFLLSDDTFEVIMDVTGLPVTVLYNDEARFSRLVKSLKYILKIKPVPRKFRKPKIDYKTDPRTLPPLPKQKTFFWLMQPITKEDALYIPDHSFVNAPLTKLTFEEALSAVSLSERRNYPEETLDFRIQIIDYDEQISEKDLFATAPKTTRASLAPGESKRWLVTFFPKSCSSDEREIVFEVGGWRRSAVKVLCSGSGDVPAIDINPRALFALTSSDKVKANKPMYLEKKHCFHFGPVLIPKNKDSRVHGVTSSITFNNISNLTVELSCTFQRNILKEKMVSFGFKPTVLFIKPHTSEALTIWASPHMPGLQSEYLVVCLVNNPEPVIIKLTCTGVRGKCAFQPTEIKFDRVMLLRKLTKSLALRNTSSLPLNWKLTNAIELLPQIKTSHSSGKIFPHSTELIWLTYHATIVESINKELLVEIYDQHWRGPSVQEQQIKIFAESYDVSVTILMPENIGNHLDFKNIKVGQDYSLPFGLQNDGPDDIIYRMVFEAPKNLFANPAEVFSVNSSRGILSNSSKHPSRFVLTVNCPFEVNIVEVPILNVKLFHPENIEDLIATLPIPVSLTTKFSKYKIYPLPELNFGIMDVDGFKSLEITIENIGTSDFSFVIISREQLEEYLKRLEPTGGVTDLETNLVPASESSYNMTPAARFKLRKKSFQSAKFFTTLMMGKNEKGKTAKGSKKTKTAKSGKSEKGRRKKKIAKAEKQSIASRMSRLSSATKFGMKYSKSARQKETFFPKSVGPFIVQRTVGTLLPNEFIRIRIDCLPKFDREFVETIFFEVSGSPELYEFGVPVTLRAIANYPIVDFSDYQTMFQMVDIVESFNVYDKSHCSPGCVYSISERVLEFYDTIVGYKHTAELLIENKGLVPAVVQLFLEKDTEVEDPNKHYDMAFSLLTANELFIQPYSTGKFTVEFAPTSLNESVAALKLKLINSPGMRHLYGQVRLRGFGVFPTISIIRPYVPEVLRGEPVFMDFGTAAVGDTIEKFFTFKNIGSVKAKVLVEMVSNAKHQFYMIPSDEAILQLLKTDKIYEETVIVQLKCDEQVDFKLFYAPTEAGPINASIKLHVVDNSFILNEIKITGYAFTDNIIIEGLTYVPANRANRYKTTRSSILKQAYYYYELSFTECITSIFYKKTIKLINNTNDIYRVVCPNTKHIKFVPKIMHILPSSYQKVYVLLLSNHQLYIQNMSLKIQCEPIAYRTPNVCNHPWFIERRYLTWLSEKESGKHSVDEINKIFELSEEPLYDPIGQEFDIHLDVSAVSDYAFLQFGISKVQFHPTFVYQTNEQYITLDNLGTVGTNYRIDVDRVNRITCWSDEDNIEPCCSMGLVMGNKLYPTVVPDRPKTAKSFTTMSEITTKSLDDYVNSLNKFGPKPLSPTDVFLDENCRIDVPLEFPPLESVKESFQNVNFQNMFAFEPMEGFINGQSTVKIKVVFKPTLMGNYSGKLHLRYAPDSEITLNFSGVAKSSYCHIEHEQSDYLTSGRNPFASTAKYPKNTKVIEIRAIGVNVSFLKHFVVFNPTPYSYRFYWSDANFKKQSCPVFVCSTPAGTIDGRKGILMAFGFIPPEVGTFESLWEFSVPECKIVQPILFVGITRNPLLSFSPYELMLRPTIKGIPSIANFTLFNKDDIEVTYTVDHHSLYNKEQDQKLTLQPLSGTIQPMNEENFCVQFDPKVAKEMMFAVKFKISKMKSPISLRIFTKCYETECILSYEKNMYETVKLNPTKRNIIDVGNINLRIPQKILFKLINPGKISYYYDWYVKPHSLKISGLDISWDNQSGIITAGAEIPLVMTVTAIKKDTFQNVPIIFKTTKGPEYMISLKGSSNLPQYTFSFRKYLFGHRLIQDSDITYNEILLTISNLESEPLTVEKVSHDVPAFKIDFTSRSIEPRSSADIKINFYPRELKSYKHSILFLINGVYKEKVKLFGKGDQPEIVLADIKDGIVNFLGVSVDTEVSKQVKILNSSRATVSFTLNSVGGKTVANPIKIKPSGLITMRPQQELKLVVTYSPKSREQESSQTIMFNCQGHVQRLFIVKTSSIGYKFNLDKPVLPFGMAIIGCTTVLNVALVNSGEIGARYYWDFSNVTDMFSINPQEGYSCPGSSVVFTVTFFPHKLIKVLRKEVYCYIENYEKLTLILSGTCVELPPPREYVYFETPVRRVCEQPISLTNKSNTYVTIKPVLSGEWFYGEESIRIPPKATMDYKVSYAPLKMTNDQLHQGNAFLPFPDGSSLLFGLEGYAGDPLPENELTFETFEKEDFKFKIEVKNWLKQQKQRFSVTIDQAVVREHYPFYRTKGNDFLDVPGGSSRQYEVLFTASQPANIKLKVTFVNDSTSEYLFYLVTITVHPVETSIETVEMTTYVRNPITRRFYFENIYEKSATIKFETDVNYIKAINPVLTLNPASKDFIEIEFSPIKEMKDVNHLLEFDSPQLGMTYYDGIFTAYGPKLENPFYLTEHLGDSNVFKMPIKLLQQSTKAVAQVYSQDIKIVNSVNETDKYGQFELRLHYEPTFLGDLSILLEVNTEETGNYKYPLILKSLPPKPKGPFILAPEQEIKISFKNVFTKKQTFFCACRSPVFLVKVTQFELKPKAVKIIPVKMLPKSKIPAEYKHDHYPVTASVRIVCSDPLYINTQWDFYLKGLLAAPPPPPADRDPRKPSAIQSSTKVNMKASAFKLPTSK